MAKIIGISEHFQHFVAELQESLWGDLEARTRQAAQQFFDGLSEGQRDRYMVSRRYVRSAQRQDYRNGYYPRDFVTKFGTLRLRVARTRKRGFLPALVTKFQRRAEDVTHLIREAFLRGISTRQVGRFAESGQVPVKSRLALQVLNSSGVVMAQQCDICGKKPQAGNRISHAHNVTKRRWNINLRPVHAKVAGQGKRMRVCTSCLRSGKVVKA